MIIHVHVNFESILLLVLGWYKSNPMAHYVTWFMKTDKRYFSLVSKYMCMTEVTNPNSWIHYSDVKIAAMASQITSLTIVYSTVYSGADQRKHHRSASLAFVRGIHRWPVNSPHKWPVTRKMFPFDNVIMLYDISRKFTQYFIDATHCVYINSLSPGRSECDSKNGIFNLALVIGIFRSSHDNALRSMPHDLTGDKSTLVQVMAWCRQATSHYLSQWWLSPLSPYGVARPQWVKAMEYRMGFQNFFFLQI